MNIQSVFEANDTNALEEFGMFTEVKNAIEEQIAIELNDLSWEELHSSITALKKNVKNNREELLSLNQELSLEQLSKKISSLLNFSIKAKTTSQIINNIRKLVDICDKLAFDPSQRFEETKFKNFKSSSKLEGIDIESPDKSITLESVLAKYKRKPGG